jgi:hypothetical protein
VKVYVVFQQRYYEDDDEKPSDGMAVFSDEAKAKDYAKKLAACEGDWESLEMELDVVDPSLLTVRERWEGCIHLTTGRVGFRSLRVLTERDGPLPADEWSLEVDGEPYAIRDNSCVRVKTYVSREHAVQLLHEKRAEIIGDYNLSLLADRLKYTEELKRRAAAQPATA